MQVLSSSGPGSGAPSQPQAASEAAVLARDLYAIVAFLHKNTNADLFAAIGELQLTLTQAKLLHNLEDAGRDLTLSEAGALVNISVPAASRLVEELVRRQLVSRTEDDRDRRIKRIGLTPQGETVIRKLNAARLQGLRQFTQSLTDPERQALAPALEQLLSRPEVCACRPDLTEEPA